MKNTLYVVPYPKHRDYFEVRIAVVVNHLVYYVFTSVQNNQTFQLSQTNFHDATYNVQLHLVMVLTEVILQGKKHFVSCSGSPASRPKGSLSETDEKNRQHLRWQIDNDVSPNLDPL